MIKRMECDIYGRVHMVMFRDFTCRNAKKIGLVGIVRNVEDGSVKVLAEGEEVLLKEFLRVLRKGPYLARVDRLKEKWSEPAGEFSDFKIVYYS